MERVKAHECGALPTWQTWTPDSNHDGAFAKRPSVGEDEAAGGAEAAGAEAAGAEARLPGKGPAATSLLQIAIRNGIYQNQVAHAGKSVNMPSANMCSGTSSTSLLSKRRHRRNLSLGCPPTSGAAPSASPLSTLSLDRKTFLRQKQSKPKQLVASDKAWVTSDLRRGCIHVHDWLTPSYPRPVLCTVDTVAAQVVSKLQASKAEGVLRVTCQTAVKLCKEQMDDMPNGGPHPKDVKTNEAHLLLTKESCFDSSLVLDDNIASKSSSELCLSDIGAEVNLYSGSDLETSTCEEVSLGGAQSPLRQDSPSQDAALATDSSAPSPNGDTDPFASSSDEMELGSSPTPTAYLTRAPKQLASTPGDSAGGDSPQAASGSRTLSKQASPPPALFVQLHGGIVRRLRDDERPLQIFNDYLGNLGFQDPCRVQEEGLNPAIGGLIRFYFGKPRSAACWERVQLSGVFNVRKGKLVLPVNRWSKRHVTLSGTCLIVSSVKHTGKIHVLPLVGGKVEEVKRHSRCLALSSAGTPSPTYYISYDSYAERLRWHRTASEIAAQRLNSVDLSCCSLEELPAQLYHSQDLTHLELKNNFMSLHKGVPALSRFCQLRSLSLSNNALPAFPLALCELPSLTELDLSANRLADLPVQLGSMRNLQSLVLDANRLTSLPSELSSLEALLYLGLSFNRFTCIPPVLEKMKDVDKLCLAGNQMTLVHMAALRRLSTRHVDLRLNRLQSVTVGDVVQLEHIVQLDLRDAGLQELDVTPLCQLEVLYCDRNRLSRLRVGGHALKSLHAAHNELKELQVQPVPGNVTLVDLSWNQLGVVPDWLCESSGLQLLDISHNRVTELPPRLLSNGKLRTLLAGWNALSQLGDNLEASLLEMLDLQHNRLKELPSDLFVKAQNLRYLNASANELESLPAAGLSEDALSSLKELYVANNSLSDKCVPLLAGHAHLRVLHLSYNRLQTFTASKLARLEELDLSGNRLRTVPASLLNCQRLQTLSAHSNCIDAFPQVLQLPEIKCVDLGCNQLSEISLPEALPPELVELDLKGNPRLNLDHKSLELLNHIRCLRLDPLPSAPSAGECHGAPAVWSHGYTEVSGVKNKLCVAALALDTFCGVDEALYGVFDGDGNVEVPYLLQCTMGDVLAEELQRGPRQADYMTNTFLTMQRKLGTAGQRMGGSAALCHIRHEPAPAGEHGGCFTLKTANVGRCQAVLCRDGKATRLSAIRTVKDQLEWQRVRQHNAVVTEDNKVSGISESTRMMGYSFLCPSVSPRPHVSTVTLTPQDEFFLLGSRGLWDTLSPGEAVEAVRNVADALAAAKKLVTLAHSYGCSRSLSAVVVQLSLSQDRCEPPPHSPALRASGDIWLPPASWGAASEPSSELSASQMSSEVGSAVSSEEPQAEPSAARPPACFRRRFSGALSDNGLDSEDEEPIPGVFSNGSRVEVEADVHSLDGRDCPPSRARPSVPRSVASSHEPPPVTPCSPRLGGETRWRRARANGSVACRAGSQDLIEEAADAPVKKQGGYFHAPTQPDPDDQLIVPPELEDEVRRIIRQQQMETREQQEAT